MPQWNNSYSDIYVKSIQQNTKKNIEGTNDFLNRFKLLKYSASGNPSRDVKAIDQACSE